MIKIFIQAAQNTAPQRIFIHNLSNRVQHIRSFVIHILRTFFVHVVMPDNRFIILNIFSCADDIFRTGFFAVIKLCEQRFTVRRKTFMHPHIGNIFGRDIIAKPFVTGFMHDNKIPFQSPTCTRPICAQITVGIFIAVSYRTLVFHTQIRHFH